MKVSFSESALDDLDQVKQYYSDLGSPKVAEDFVTEIFARTEPLLDHPDIGRIVPEFNEEHIRELIHPPYRVVYLRSKRSVTVIRVWRSERVLTLEEG